MFYRMRMGTQVAPAASNKAASSLDLATFTVKVHEVNANVPENVLVVPGGPTPNDLSAFLPEQLPGICNALLQALTGSPRAWKVFFDTDGDLNFSPYTKIAMHCADGVIVPLEASQFDFKRVETFLVVSQLDHELHLLPSFIKSPQGAVQS